MKRGVIAMILAPLALAQTAPSFEVASIKPSNSTDRRQFFNIQPSGQIALRNLTVKRLIAWAYDLKQYQISGGPGWIDSDLFDVSAKPESPAKPEVIKQMLQSLMAERFQLVVRRETREMPGYALVVAKNGPKFKEVQESDPNLIDLSARPDLAGRGGRPRIAIVRRGRLTIQGADMPLLVSQLSNILGRAVVDETGLTGTYDLKLEWVPDEYQVTMFQSLGVPDGFGAPAADWQGPTLFTALEEQLGLKLESQRGPVEMFLVESVQKPSEN